MERAAKQRGSTSNVGIVKPGFPAGRVGLPRFFAAAQCKCPSKERRTSSHFVERSLGPKLVSLGRIGIRSLSMAPWTKVLRCLAPGALAANKHTYMCTDKGCTCVYVYIYLYIYSLSTCLKVKRTEYLATQFYMHIHPRIQVYIYICRISITRTKNQHARIYIYI